MENKQREVVVYKDYFLTFFAQQERKVQDKIIKILDIIEQLERIPESYLKYIVETDGLYEIRVQLGNRIFRILCFFDGNRVVVLLTGFLKKEQKTPQNEIQKALRLKKAYYDEKKD
jgi:phage-related protein